MKRKAMKDKYYKIPTDAQYLKCVYGTMFVIRRKIVLDEHDEWKVIEVQEELEPFKKNE